MNLVKCNNCGIGISFKDVYNAKAYIEEIFPPTWPPKYNALCRNCYRKGKDANE